MDIIAHGLWSYAVFYKKKYVWLATLFGIMPDLLSFGILYIATILSGGEFNGIWPAITSLPTWLKIAYNLTHSLIIFVFVFLLIYFITKKWFWSLTAWGLHVLIDIPTHSSRYFPTPFLWPLSNYTFNGIIWGTTWFVMLNYGSLFIAFAVIGYDKFRKKI